MAGPGGSARPVRDREEDELKAARLVEIAQPLVIEDVPDPQPGPRDAIVKVAVRGDLPHGLAHLAGRLVLGGPGAAAADHDGPRVRRRGHGGGRRGHRRPRRRPGGGALSRGVRRLRATAAQGRSNLCDAMEFLGMTHDGGYAEYVRVVNADLNCVPLPETVSYEAAAALGCRFMTAWHALQHQAKLRAGEWLAVHGVGGIGLSAVQIGAASGAAVIAVDIDDRKLDAATRQGAALTINARGRPTSSRRSRTPPTAAPTSRSGGLGTASLVHAAIMSLRKGGRLVQVGLTSKEEQGDRRDPAGRADRGGADDRRQRRQPAHPPARAARPRRRQAAGPGRAHHRAHRAGRRSERARADDQLRHHRLQPHRPLLRPGALSP